VLNFSVSAKALRQEETAPEDKNANGESQQTVHCQKWKTTDNPVTRLYLKDWLNNYFETINVEYVDLTKTPYEDKDLTSALLHRGRPLIPPPPVPAQFKMQSVVLSTTILLIGDISGGATPNLLGNGSTFIVPVNGICN
jgi:hypothetical protein